MTSPDQAALLDEVLATFADTPDPRLRQIMEAVVRKLHELVAELELTREEWLAAIQFLTATGKKCDDVRQEFILLSDTLGVSSLVEIINQQGAGVATANTVLGPFYVPGAPERELGDTINLDPRDEGQELVIDGVVQSPDGEPIAGAELDVWQTATSGFYDVQDPTQPRGNLRGRFHTADDGTYHFRTVRPVPYPIPTDGPVGKMLETTKRHPMRAAHTHILVRAEGYHDLITHVFDADSPHLDSDAVFGVRPSLTFHFDDGEGGGVRCHFDITLATR